MQKPAFLSLVVLVFLLSACSQTPKQAHIQLGSEHQTALSALQHWKLRGKIAFKSDAEKFSANLNWQQQGDDLDLKLSSFIGTTLMQLSRKQGVSEMEVDSQHYQDYSATRLIERVTGLRIPLSGLSHWIKGAATNQSHAQYAPDGTLQSLQASCLGCNSWQINYARYSAVEHYFLPHLITLKQADILVKIKINKWTLQP